MTGGLMTEAPVESSSVVASPRLSVVLVDDHPVLTTAVATVLRAEPDFGIVRAAVDLASAQRLIAELQPNLVILDVRLESADGLSLLPDLVWTSPCSRVVVLTAHPYAAVLRCARVGSVYAVLPKGIGLDELLDALRRVAAGERLDPPVSANPPPALTGREIEVLQLLAAGHDPHQAARRLGLSTHTVRDHLKGARRKLGVQTQLGAVVAAADLGVIDVGPRA